MAHILDTSHEELERTHRLVDSYREQTIKTRFYSFFPNSFKKTFANYAAKKEDLLLSYKGLHNDIHSKKVDPMSNSFIQEQLTEITELIDASSKSLSSLVAHSDTQEDILLHEKVFFVKLLESFHTDILVWVGTHEVEVFWEHGSEDSSNEENPIKKWIEILKRKKKKLEDYIATSSKK